MSLIRYKQSRILVRPVCRLPGESKAAFAAKKRRIRKHFERFNIDVADICQWLMSIRKKVSECTSISYSFWDFFLEPSRANEQLKEKDQDRLRLVAVDHVLGIRACDLSEDDSISDDLRKIIDKEAREAKTQNTVSLFDRLKLLDKSHRLILLKSAAEWIIARYHRGFENWKRQHEEWTKEKLEWEGEHPELTENAREVFTNVFKQLREDSDLNGTQGIRRKNPRICSFDRLKLNKNNCVYAGEKGHGPLCWKYAFFISQQRKKNNNVAKHFWENAEKFLKIRNQLERPEVKNKLKTSPRQEAFNRLYQQKGMQAARQWFTTAWTEYLDALNVTEQTLLSKDGLPHCQKIGNTFDKSECQWNPHTELCLNYQQAVSRLPEELQRLDSLYREWRRSYLAGPRKPSFRYPSSKRLPMPKLFGSGYYEIDWNRSVIRIRLDDMQQGEWIELGFKPWPRDYKPGVKDISVSSIHLNFSGSRARAGFCFEVIHQPSRFTCAQEQLDELRSRQFPRQAHDQQFLEAARKCLENSFNSGESKPIRLLAIDLGESGAYGSLYDGRKHLNDFPLEIVKIDQCYNGIPTSLAQDQKRNPVPPFPLDKDRDWRGLRKEHVGHHLQQMQSGACKLAEYRQIEGQPLQTLRTSDFRSLSRHIRWMLRDWARHNASKIIGKAEENKVDVIVFESLRGFRPRGYDIMDLEQKRRLAFFAYGQIRKKVTEKAVERGMRVVTVPYGLSSQICSRCSHLQQDSKRFKKNKKERLFICECAEPCKKKPSDNSNSKSHACNCKEKLNSDANSARVLGRVFWGDIILPTKIPKC